MELFITLLVIGLLEENVGSYSRFFELSIVFNGGCCDIYVDASDGAVFMLYRIDGVDALQDILYWIVFWVLSGLNGEALMAHVLKCSNLAHDFLLRKLLSRNVLIFKVIRTVYAAVNAVV